MTFLERFLLFEELLHLNKYYLECIRSPELVAPYLCPSKGHKHDASIQSSINVVDTFLRMFHV